MSEATQEAGMSGDPSQLQGDDEREGYNVEFEQGLNSTALKIVINCFYFGIRQYLLYM